MLSHYLNVVESHQFNEVTGSLVAINASIVEASGCEVRIGELVEIEHALNKSTTVAEVIGLKAERIVLMPYGSTHGLCLNSRVKPLNKSSQLHVSKDILGRVVDAMGNPLKSGEKLSSVSEIDSIGEPVNPLCRKVISDILTTNVKVVDAFLPLGKGQKIGIFAGSGVGKSTLLGMLTQNTQADVVVIALVGERGREVAEFVEDILGKEGMEKAVVVVATSEQPAALRKQAAISATAIAEWFKNQGKDVLLIMDSITRFAMAQREIGVSAGESLGSRGYPASVYTEIPTLVERAGNFHGAGSITAIYTVLVEGDDMNEPISDHMRSILDGHIVLSRDLAATNHYPAIDVLNSVSRLFGKLLTAEQKTKIGKLREIINVYFEAKELVELGAYEMGNDAKIDLALNLKEDIFTLLKQSTQESINSDVLWTQVDKLASKL